MKTCSKCEQSKSLDSFSIGKQSKDGLYPYCKDCCKIVQKQYRSSDEVKKRIKLTVRQREDRRNELNKKYYNERTPESKARRADKQLKSHLKRAYGITVEDYNNMLDKQEGKCDICKIHQNALPKRLAVDHCHVTGKVRSLLCTSCNTTLGHTKEDLNILESLINYIKKYQD